MLEIILAVAGLAGFIFEWRREARASQRDEQNESRIADLERDVADLKHWRERVGRAH